MANNATAILNKYQAKITQMFQAGELRFRQPAVFNSLKASTEVMIPSHTQIKNAAKRTSGEVNYVARTKRSLGTGGEIHNHSGSVGDSAILVPSWTVYDDKFKYSVKQGNDKVWETEELVQSELINMFSNFAEGLEGAAADFLHANRSGVNTYSRQGTFNATNDVFEVTQDVTDIMKTGYRAVQIVKSAMDFNKWSGSTLVMYCDTVWYDKHQALAQQGSGNNLDLSFNFSGVEFIKSVELDAKAVALGYTDGYCVVAPFGTLATMDWIPMQNRNGLVTTVNSYGTIIDPNTGLAMATHEYEARSDESGGAGDVQDVSREIQAFTYLSFNHAPLTTADETPLQAFAFVPYVQA
jgi:hypothetical protein